MFCIGRDGEVYSCDSFKAFSNPEASSAIALYAQAPVPGIRNMYMRFYPNSIREVDPKSKDHLLDYVPNVKVPSSKYTLSLTSDKDIPLQLRRVFQVMSYEDSNLPKNLPNTISDLLYVENLPSFIKDIQRFMFDVLGEDTIDLIDAEYDHPSGCTLINPYQSPGHSKPSTERLGVFYRFVPVSYDITCTKGFGYIIQDDMYKYIEDLEGNWKIIIYSYSKENPPEILDENDNYQEVEICGWQDPRSFFDIAYYTSISCNLLNRLTPAREYRATASFGDKIPGTSYARYTRWFSTGGNFDQNGNTDVCFDSFVTLRMAGRIK